jgi:peptide/nickel transport system permease protein
VPVLLGIALVTFLIIRLAPGDPAAMLVDTTLLSGEELARFRAGLGLDAPLPVQFVTILKQLATGEILSLRTGQPVLAMIADRLPITAALLGGAITVSLLLGVPMGVLSARRPYGHVDNWLSIAALGGSSLPGFWFGLVLMWVFAGILRILPASGTGPATSLHYTALDMVPYFVMPIAVLASGLLPPVMRYTRSSMLEALAQDYVRTARSKGLSESLVSVPPCAPQRSPAGGDGRGLARPLLIGSTAVIESVFAMPGIGRLVVEAALNRTTRRS